MTMNFRSGATWMSLMLVGAVGSSLVGMSGLASTASWIPQLMSMVFAGLFLASLVLLAVQEDTAEMP